MVVTAMCTEDGILVGEADGAAKPVAFANARPDEFALLRPTRAVSVKDIRRAKIVAELVVPLCTNDRVVATERNGISKPVSRGTVRCGELGLLCPTGSIPVKHVC